MRNLKSVIPIILFPYVYMFVIAGFIISVDNIKSEAVANFMTEYGLLFMLAIALISVVVSLVNVISHAVKAGKGKISAKDAAFVNMMIKLIQIPAYIINFILGFFSMALSVWGIGLLLWVIIVDLITIIYTGINAIGACVSLGKNKVFGKGVCILFGFLNFIYCVDVVAAIVMYVRTRLKLNNISQNEELSSEN